MHSAHSVGSSPPAARPVTAISRLQAYQLTVFFLTFISYTASHFSRKSYATVKPELLQSNYSSSTLGRMDSTFMVAYSVGSIINGHFGDVYNPARLLACGLLGSSVSLALMVVIIHSELAASYPSTALWTMFTNYIIFGLFQSTGGPAGTAIMGAWFVDPISVKNRGTIFGIWTCHQYVGDILAALCTAIVLHLRSEFGVTWLWALIFPSSFSLLVGLLILTLKSEPRELGIVALCEPDDDDCVEVLGENIHDAAEEEPKTPIAFMKALAIPNVVPYAIAFGFFKLTNYALFFWLPFFMSLKSSDVMGNLIAALYSVGMMPGGIIVGYCSDLLNGKRATVIAVFMCLLVACLVTMAVAEESMSNGFLLLMLLVMGTLVGGPNNIITSAVATDLSSNYLIGGHKKSLATVTGIINGCGSIIASVGLLAIAPLKELYGWSSIWWFLVGCTVAGTLFLAPQIVRENYNSRTYDCSCIQRGKLTPGERTGSPLSRREVVVGYDYHSVDRVKRDGTNIVTI